MENLTKSSEIIRDIANCISRLITSSTESTSCLFLFTENGNMDHMNVSFIGFGQLYQQFMNYKSIEVQDSCQLEDISWMSHELVSEVSDEVNMKLEWADENMDSIRDEIPNFYVAAEHGTLINKSPNESTVIKLISAQDQTEELYFKNAESPPYTNMATNSGELPSAIGNDGQIKASFTVNIGGDGLGGHSDLVSTSSDGTNKGHVSYPSDLASISNNGTIKDEANCAFEETESQVDEESMSCEICGQEFLAKQFLRTHEKVHRQRQCEVCGDLFRNEHYHKNHMKMHHDGRTHECKECTSQFDNYNDFFSHFLYTHSQEKSSFGTLLYKCMYCPKLLKTKQGVRTHADIHYGKIYKCKYCPDSFSCMSETMKHEKRHFDKSLNCPYCSEQFTSRDMLKVHTTARHPYSMNNFFLSVQSPRKGLKENDEAKATVTMVPKMASRRKALQAFICNICGKRFRHLLILKRHQMQHVRPDIFKCPHCDKINPDYETMVNHEMVHSVQVYTCELCDLYFAKKKKVPTATLR